jgi:hypothetical protein
MKIVEIIGSVVDQEHQPAPVGGFMQHVANAFTATGRVKRPLNFQGLGGQPTTALPAFSSVPSSDEGISLVPSADAVPNSMVSSTDAVPNAVALVPTYTRPEFRNPSPARGRQLSSRSSA